jgi:predicted ArsR family transcriptional regulator
VVPPAGDGISRDEAAAELGISRDKAAFHLDRLVEAGLVEISFRRLGAKRGPGAGRPSKLYRRSARTFAASVPPRRYDVAAEVLSGALARLDSTRAAEAITAAARARGRAVATEFATTTDRHLADLLSNLGFEPAAGSDGAIDLVNCPFHHLVTENAGQTCAMNKEFLTGTLEGMGLTDVEAQLAPRDGYCCVRICPHTAPRPG